MSRQVVLLILRVCDQHVYQRAARVPVIDHPYSASLAFAAPLLRPADLPESACTLHQIANLRINDQGTLQLRILVVGEKFDHRASEHRSLAELEHPDIESASGGRLRNR